MQQSRTKKKTTGVRNPTGTRLRLLARARRGKRMQHGTNGTGGAYGVLKLSIQCQVFKENLNENAFVCEEPRLFFS